MLDYKTSHSSLCMLIVFRLNKYWLQVNVCNIEILLIFRGWCYLKFIGKHSHSTLLGILTFLLYLNVSLKKMHCEIFFTIITVIVLLFYHRNLN